MGPKGPSSHYPRRNCWERPIEFQGAAGAAVGARAHPQRGDGDEGRRVDGGAEAGHGGVRGVRGGVEQRRQRPDHLGGEPLPQAGMSDFAATGFNSKATWFGI